MRVEPMPEVLFVLNAGDVTPKLRCIHELTISPSFAHIVIKSVEGYENKSWTLCAFAGNMGEDE